MEHRRGTLRLPGWGKHGANAALLPPAVLSQEAEAQRLLTKEGLGVSLATLLCGWLNTLTPFPVVGIFILQDDSITRFSKIVYVLVF